MRYSVSESLQIQNAFVSLCKRLTWLLPTVCPKLALWHKTIVVLNRTALLLLMEDMDGSAYLLDSC